VSAREYGILGRLIVQTTHEDKSDFLQKKEVFFLKNITFLAQKRSCYRSCFFSLKYEK
jgi:hypothetical protein